MGPRASRARTVSRAPGSGNHSAVAVKLEDRVRRSIARVGEEISEKAWTIGRDPAAERRKRLQWTVLQGAVGALFTLGARRLGTKVWGVLAGEQPPAKT
jgi:hypothetical protein